MRLATIETWAGPRAAVQVGDAFVDIHAADAQLPANVRQLLEGGPALLQAAAAAAQRHGIYRYESREVRFRAAVHEPRKIVCVGLNYKDHAAESGAPIPRDPVLFSKYATALIGHGDNIVLPAVSQKVDYEAELVVVIGKRGRRVPAASALEYVAGYTCGHDVSARDWQLEKDGKQWMAGKTFDTFAPVGPVIVTADEIADPYNLRIQFRLNGQTMQDSSTSQLIFSIGEVIAYVSQVMTIEPGDLIFTGTPPGVGAARNPPVFLKPADVCEVEIEGLGILRNPVVGE